MQSIQTNNSDEDHPAPPAPTLDVLTDIQFTTTVPSDIFIPEYPSPPGFSSADELYDGIPDVFPYHEQALDFYFTDPFPEHYDLEEDANNINVNLYYSPDLVYPPWPAPAGISDLLTRDDAAAEVLPTPDYTLTSFGSNEPPLRATLPAPFLYFFPREYIEVENIIPRMVHQGLVDLHKMPMDPTPFFLMPDTRSYAQFLSNFSQHMDSVTYRYYSKVPRNPSFADELTRPRIYPIELLKRLPNHLETYRDAFPEPLPMVIIRNSEVISTNLPAWFIHGIMLHVLPIKQHPSNGENSENPEDTLWSMALKRGVSVSYRPYTSREGLPRVATSPAQSGNMIYSAEELTYFNFAVNVFMELSSLPGLNEPAAVYKGAFILHVIDIPVDPACWTEFSEDRKMDIYDRAPHLFDGLPPFLKCPDFPAVNLHFQNWDINLLGVLDDLKFETVDDVTGVVVATNGN